MSHHDYILELKRRADAADGFGLTAWEIDRLDEWAEQAAGDATYHLTERQHEIAAEIEEKLNR